MTVSKWDQRFTDVARLVSTWSKDPSTQVGAVIVDAKKRVISVGFNGYPRGVDDTYDTRERKLLRTIHAEANALMFARRSVEGCTIYVTHHPCANCAAKLIQSGITRVVIGQDINDRWADHVAEAKMMFEESGVEVVHINDD